MPAPPAKPPAPAVPRRPYLRSARTAAIVGWSFALLVLAALTGSVIHLSELEHFTALLAAARPQWLLVALALQLGTYASEAAIWYLLLRLIGHRQRWTALVPLSLAKLFADQAVPTGGLSGNILVVEVLARRGVPARSAVAALMTGAIVYFLAYFAMSLLALGVLRDHHALSRLMILGVTVLAAVALGLPGLLLAIAHLQRPRWLDRLASARPVAAALAMIGDAWPLVRRHPGPIAAAFVFQALIFVLDGATLWAMLHAIGQTAEPMVPIAAFMVGSIAASLGPFPLGLGGFEAACTSMLTLLGTPLEAAFTATFLLRGMTLWLPMLPGLWLARWEIRQAARRAAQG